MSKQTIYNILAAKAEPVKVDLGAQEMYKTASDANRVLGDLIVTSRLAGIESALRSNVSSAYNWFKKLEADMRDFEAKAKELGMQPESVANYKFAQKALNDAQYEIANAEQVLAQLKKLI